MKNFKTSERIVALEALALARENTPGVVGKHIGRGPHVDMPATWDGLSEEVPPGWAGVVLESFKDEDGGDFYALELEEEVKLIGEKKPRLEAFLALADVKALLDSDRQAEDLQVEERPSEEPK